MNEHEYGFPEAIAGDDATLQEQIQQTRRSAAAWLLYGMRWDNQPEGRDFWEYVYHLLHNRSTTVHMKYLVMHNRSMPVVQQISNTLKDGEDSVEWLSDTGLHAWIVPVVASEVKQ